MAGQDYIGADYGLVDCSPGVPLPDYYTALVWARTMGTTVLDVHASASAGSAPDYSMPPTPDSPYPLFPIIRTP